MRLDFGQPEDEFAVAAEEPAAVTGPPPATAPAEVRAAEAAALIAWVEKSGGTVDVKAAPAKVGGIGLEATKAVRRGDVLLSVPLSLGLSAESALRSSIGVYLAEFEPLLADYAFIALALIHERRLGDQSEFAPWLNGCPSLLPAAGFADLPLLWSEKELTELAGATTAGAAERLEDVKEDFEWLKENVFASAPAIFPPSVFSLQAYTAAIATALSRALPIAATAGDEYDARPILLPVFDLVNHDASQPSAAVVGKPARKAGPFGGAATVACATLIAGQEGPEIDSGVPLTVRYGGSSAGELLLDYGFLSEPVAVRARAPIHTCFPLFFASPLTCLSLPPHLAQPVAPLTFAIDYETDMLYDEKCDCLELNGLTEESTWLIAEDGEIPPTELLAFLRLKNLNGADAFLLEPVFIDTVWQEHLQLPVSEANEKAALQEVGERCEAALKTFGSTVQADLRTLAEADRTSREYMLSGVRYAERRALSAASRSIETRLGQLKQLEYYQERRLNSLGLQPIESEEEIEALARAAGRQISSSDVDW